MTDDREAMIQLKILEEVERVVREETPWRLFYLSFADASRAKGAQWLGACVVRAPSFMLAIPKAHRLGCNPGGEVVGGPLPPGFAPPDGDQIGRLLARAETLALNAEIDAFVAAHTDAPPAVFTCGGCGGVFASDWPEDKALAEMARAFPDLKREDAAILCDDCWRAVTEGPL